MKKLIGVVMGVAVVAIVSTIGCSQENREEAMDRFGKAAKALKGEGEGAATPDIVKEQQRKERIRQNTTWTPENQALHPVEYCQAQLVEIEEFGKKLDVQMHQLATTKSGLKRTLEDNQSQVSTMEKFLKDAKAAYRKADAANAWPMAINGFQLSKENAQTRIVDAANKIPQLNQRIALAKTNLTRLDKKMDGAVAERRKLADVRSRIQSTITDLQTKKILDGERGITDALNAINDSISALNGDSTDPTLEELAVPDKDTERAVSFERIMAE